MKLSTGAALLAVASFALGACGSGKTTADIAAEQGILLVGNQAEPKTLDPHTDAATPESRIGNSICEGLVRPHPTDDMDVAPGAAASWSSDDLITWTFKLQPEGKWSDGTPVTAQDFVFSWKRALTPALGASYPELLYFIKGAEAFNKGKTDDFSTVGVRAIDASTLEVELVGPTPFFLQLVRNYGYSPVQRAAIEANGAIDDRRNDWAVPGKFVCNGAFTLKEWRTNQYVELEKNPQYWDADNVTLNGIRFLPVENAQTETTMFFGNQLHMTAAMQMGKFPALKERYPDLVHSHPILATTYLAINTQKGALKDPRVRKALSLAIDRETLTEKVLKSGSAPASGVVPQGIPRYARSTAPLFDPERARELLAEAGYPDGQGFPPTELLTISSEDHRKLAEVTQFMWKKNLGIEVAIYNQEWKVYLDSLNSHDFDISYAAWAANYAYPTTFIDSFVTGSTYNAMQWSNPQFDSLIARIKTAPTREAQLALSQQAEDLIADEVPVIPMYWRQRNYLVQERGGGVVARPMNMHSYQDMWFKPE
ncbi:peptide ABC transporter substrate-binding protein [Croceicoccus gelatinilyticus]|uniref:peptide ABC transporter substrate-binding protein n=1 Tax=Croceicoccus gelatinilyticus TaxID=2835536 RepID=UPI001BD0652C|nr:peptide ABC transporter substrate-binding protein [Croceicoccus gelatinilyticus]MBS7670755.1 peptide ABC transporter substrate-binding protein [Croceicoccus gelatinilyticus]